MNPPTLAESRLQRPFRTPSRAVFQRPAVAVIAGVMITGCRGAPTVDVVGSFFPAWMLCMIFGVVGSMVLRHVFIKAGLEADLGPRPLVYFCLWILLTLASWLLFFRS